MIVSNFQIKYAQALIKVAGRLKAADAVFDDLKALSKLFRNKNFKELMGRVVFTSNQVKVKMVEAAFQGKIHQLTLNLLKILSLRKRVQLVPKIYEVYSRLYHEIRGTAEITVRVARVLSPDEERKLTEMLLQKNKAATVHFEHKPELIGGVQIHQDGYLTDHSVQNYLQTLQHHLMSQEL